MKSSLNNPVEIPVDPVKRFTSQVYSGTNGGETIAGTDSYDKQFLVTSVYLERIDSFIASNYPVVRVESDGSAITEDFDTTPTVQGRFYKLNIINESYMVFPQLALAHGEVLGGDEGYRFRYHIQGIFIDPYTP